MTTVEKADFTQQAEPHRHELRVHCYRLLGSFDEAEDLVQETFLRAWRKRETYEGRASMRAWLYGIATNACLDFLDRVPRTPSAPELPLADDCDLAPRPAVTVPWLQPYPDAAAPDVVAEARETIELAFLAAVQHLPPRQRAVLILRDVVGWPSRETASALGTTPGSVDSTLRRARAELKDHLPAKRTEWTASPEGREVVQRYMAALTAHDEAALAALLREDVRCGHQPGAGGYEGPEPTWYRGREEVLEGWAPALRGPHGIDFHLVETSANGGPAIACYAKLGGEFRAFALNTLSIVDGQVAEVDSFRTDVFGAFGLPSVLPA